MNFYLKLLKSNKSLLKLTLFKKTTDYQQYLNIFCCELKIIAFTFIFEIANSFFISLRIVQHLYLNVAYYYKSILFMNFFILIFTFLNQHQIHSSKLLLLILQNTQKQLFCFMHSFLVKTHKIFSTGMFINFLKKKVKSLKRKDSIQLLFLKFFLNFFKINQLKKKIIVVLNKYSIFVFSKLTFLNIFLKKHIIFILLKPMLKFGLLKLKRVKAIKKVLKKKLLKQFT